MSFVAANLVQTPPLAPESSLERCQKLFFLSVDAMRGEKLWKESRVHDTLWHQRRKRCLTWNGWKVSSHGVEEGTPLAETQFPGAESTVMFQNCIFSSKLPPLPSLAPKLSFPPSLRAGPLSPRNFLPPWQIPSTTLP